MSRPPRILFYVQHLLGIGHLARASRIAKAVQEAGGDITLVTGGLPVAGFPPESVHHIALPALQAASEGFSGLADQNGALVDEAFLGHRRDLLLQHFHDIAPDVVVTEAFPFGRRQMRFELLPLLEAIRAARPRPILCASVRDILQEQKKPGRNEEMTVLVREYFDHVLVHGDPGFAPLEDSFPLAAEIAGYIHYTGLVAPPAVTPAPGAGFDIVVSAGGGAVGAGLAKAALAAASLLAPGLSILIVTGPNLPDPLFESLRTRAALLPGVSVERFRQNFASVLAAAKLSVSQAGYNTVCDVLQAGCRSVLVPYATGGETEQTTRAMLLAQRGRALMLTEDRLSPETLAAAITQALAAPDPASIAMALDGAVETARFLCDHAQKVAISRQ